MSLLFNILSRVVIAFLPRSKHVLSSWLWSPSAVILEPKKIKSVPVSIVSPSICHEVTGPDAMIFVFWMLSFKPAFFTFLFHLHQEALYFLFAFCHKDGVISMSQSVQSLSRVWLFVTPWTAALQASLSFTVSQTLPKLMSIESVMPSNHLILCHPLLRGGTKEPFNEGKRGEWKSWLKTQH